LDEDDKDDKDKPVVFDPSEAGSSDDEYRERKLAESILGTQNIRKITGHQRDEFCGAGTLESGQLSSLIL
jgi:hypothetical protein